MSTNGETGKTGYEADVNGETIAEQQQIRITKQFHAKTKNFMKVSIWRQKQRVRAYFNEEKVIECSKGI